MISRMAMKDIAALREEGLEATPRDVVRLNALGLRVERGRDSSAFYCAPRVAFLGDNVLHEPELGGEMWLRQATFLFDGADEQTLFSLRLLVCATSWRDLPPATDTEKVQAAVRALLDRLAPSTVRQVANAVQWCCDGALPEDGESAPPRERGDDDGPEDMPSTFSVEFGLFWRGVALRLGSAADLKDMTTSALMVCCDRAEAATPFGKSAKDARNTAHGDYLRTLEQIRESAKQRKESEDGGN